MIEAAPGLRAVAVYEEILRRHPEIAPGMRACLPPLVPPTEETAEAYRAVLLS